MQWWMWLLIIGFLWAVGAGNTISEKEAIESDVCPRCNGSGVGMEVFEPCSRCGGSGKYNKRY